MVIDTLDNLGKYVGLNPLFADVVAFLKNNDLNALEAGKHFIKDKDLFVNIQVAKGRSKEAATLETHINMIDIQIPLDGEETFGYTPLCDLPAFEYNAEKDITKYGETMAEGYHEVWRDDGTDLSDAETRTDGYLLPTGRSCSLYL